MLVVNRKCISQSVRVFTRGHLMLQNINCVRPTIVLPCCCSFMHMTLLAHKNSISEIKKENYSTSNIAKIKIVQMFPAFHRYQYSSATTQSLKGPKRNIGLMGWFLLLVPITTFCLGTWQVKRRKWKLDLMQTLYSKTTSDPVEFPDDLQELESLEYCPVRVRGEFDHSKEILLGPRSLLVHGDASSQAGLMSSRSGQSGALVVTPFKIADKNFTILVQRGWVPSSHKDPSSRAAGQVEGEVELVGIVRLTEKRAPFVPENKTGSRYWYYRDIDAMARELSTEPIFIDAIVDSSVPWGPVGGQTRVTLRNEHMSYILTWFSLSAATTYMWYRTFILRLPLK